MLSAAVRDLYFYHGDKYDIKVDTSCSEIWENNPYISDFKHVTNNGITISENGEIVKVIDCEYPLIQDSNQKPYHFIHGYRKFLESKLEISIPQGDFKGDIHLSNDEKLWISQIEEMGIKNDFWVISAGGKNDFTAKWWPTDYYQKVVDHFRGRITFVQIGKSFHHHPPLKNVINLIDKTNLRQFIRLIHHSVGVVSPVTFAMHAAAAIDVKNGRPKNRAAVVISGGREPPHWEAYPHHRFLSTNGALSCCDNGGCWKSRCHKIGDGDEKDDDEKLCLLPILKEDNISYPKCMDMIKPEDVIRAIDLYYEGGVLEFNKIKNPKIEDDTVIADGHKKIHALTSKRFRNKAKKAFELIAKENEAGIEWRCIDDMKTEEVYDFVKDHDNMILEYNNDGDLHKRLLRKNCLYIDDFCFNDEDYTFDTDGWGFKSSVRKKSNWRNPITKLEFRDLLRFVDQNELLYNKNVSDLDEIIYVPSKCWQDTHNTIKSLKKLKNTKINKIIIPSGHFPEKTLDIVSRFASEIGLNVDISDKKGIIPENGEYIVSDHMRTIISSLLAGNSVFSFANNMITGSHATFECTNNSQLIGTKDALPFNRDYVDSVLHKLLLKCVDSSFTRKSVMKNADFRSFLNEVVQ